MKYQNGYSFLNNLYKDMYAYDSVKKVSNSDKKAISSALMVPASAGTHHKI